MATLEGHSELNWLPEQHEEQLQLGFRIIQNAFKTKVNSLEQEVKGLKLSSEEQKSNMTALQRKNSSMEVELVESHQRTQQLAEENKELFRTVQQLRTKINQLDKFKQQIMGSLQDEQAAATEGLPNYVNDEYLVSSLPLTTGELGVAPRPAHQQPPPPQRPVQALYHQQVGSAASQPMDFAPPPPPVQQSSSSTAAPSASPNVDGKQFFRQARSRLSYEAFNLFLASIKRLNNQQQTREETLEEARKLFGQEHSDLYRDFEQLLNRHAI